MRKGMLVMLAGASAALMYSQVRNGNVDKMYHKIKCEMDRKIDDMM